MADKTFVSDLGKTCYEIHDDMLEAYIHRRCIKYFIGIIMVFVNIQALLAD
jgi:hypothetical protein